MASANIDIIKEVTSKDVISGHDLCFHWAEYNYDDGESEKGFRFMWRDSKGNLLAHMGQARIPNPTMLFELIHKAAAEGWFDNPKLK